MMLPDDLDDKACFVCKTPTTRSDFIDLYRIFNTITTDWYIAGGCALAIISGNNNYSDIDIFFHNEEAHEKIYQYLLDNSTEVLKNSAYLINYEKEYNIMRTPNMSRYGSKQFSFRIEGEFSYNIQLVSNVFGPPEDIIKKFDLNVCKYYITSNYVTPLTEIPKTLYIDPNAEWLNDNILKRTVKYIGKGYMLEERCYSTLLETCVNKGVGRFGHYLDETIIENDHLSPVEILQYIVRISLNIIPFSYNDISIFKKNVLLLFKQYYPNISIPNDFDLHPVQQGGKPANIRLSDATATYILDHPDEYFIEALIVFYANPFLNFGTNFTNAVAARIYDYYPELLI